MAELFSFYNVLVIIGMLLLWVLWSCERYNYRQVVEQAAVLKLLVFECNKRTGAKEGYNWQPSLDLIHKAEALITLQQKLVAEGVGEWVPWDDGTGCTFRLRDGVKIVPLERLEVSESLGSNIAT